MEPSNIFSHFVSGGGGQEECRTFYESSCTTRYVEKRPGQFVGDTTCEKRPIELCGQGCRMEQDAPQCHDKEIDVLVDVPEEVCDLNPQKTCRFVTKLVPSLKPEHECTVIPQEVCNLKFTPPQQVDKPLKTRWCIDPNAPVERGETYEESAAAAAPVSTYGAAASAPQSYSQPAPPPPAPAPTSYSQPAPAAPAPSSYSEPAPSSYGQPSAPPPPPPSPSPVYYKPVEAPAPAPSQAPDAYGVPSQPSYGSPEPPAPTLPAYGAQPQYGKRKYR